jgi:EAL domain-containing protein (putative c-di-GMP-specific phosphodiesterase class I)/GGDEF domain-containing protein
MKDKSDTLSEYIDATIHKDFYLNKNLGLPTIVKVYQDLEKTFIKMQYLACITIQVDHLNRVEYQYGSRIYNKILTSITDLLKELKKDTFREDDIFVVDLVEVDTFAIFLSSPRDHRTKLLDHLEAIAERVRVQLEKEIFRLFYPYLKKYSRPNIGYGLVIKNPMINNMRLIMQLINNSKKMGEFLSDKQKYLSKYTLQKIIIEQDISTVFQPIVDMQTLEVLGYEALSRGPSETEFSNPLLLFILASEYGLSFELDRLCRKKAFDAVRNISTDKKIFVNTLTMTIHDPEFRGAYLKELLEDLKIKPENVVFEVSEKLAIDNYDIFRSAMKDYTDIGIVHASDDIGTGHSDLERIMELNPGYMKIDLSFVAGIDKSYIKQEIVRAIVSLAKNIDSQVIAEGIETMEEYEMLKKMNVAYGQGFLFARPCEELETACEIISLKNN